MQLIATRTDIVVRPRGQRALGLRAPAAPVVAVAPVVGAGPTSRWIEWFFGFQIACQLAMLLPGLGAARMGLRVGAFGASVLLLLLVRPGGTRHPAVWAAIGVM